VNESISGNHVIAEVRVDTHSQVPPFPLVPEFVNIECSAVKCV